MTPRSPINDRGMLLEHIISAQADALRFDAQGAPWMATIRRRDAEHLRARLRSASEGTTYVT